ncbi:hypothetical protein ZYGR_0H03320 [Zygosaccharomyces rouxii]|uniref:ZYRO0B11726p n=2 Tax=Zygosaccharomyces rouxii TaxID=4956 RepID=C5DRV8_ZYGRC|nr:uncharacterized protein ZYRO0B11726g [Zygosaccharomyces rouxii]KAH9199951.1 hypothetical protein LQ764DRAFT_234539 [Zygosaccharomyces rouxii]GAV47489.1 hypothetical protein ZYGR_0H03320 [Zygosaccharomyces rouxii]CAR26519.1 ZYRO0B11726p [Zygosaccharomyces rouxii]
MTKATRGPRSNSGLQSSSKSPTVESVNKWKIPHYYRRSPSSASQNSNSMDSNGGSTPTTPNINVMSSPKKVLIEDRKRNDSANGGSCNRPKKSNGSRSKRSSKKNPGEMVFVNYTVQDGGSDIDNNNSPNEFSQPPPKKKSSKSRMLKIFGNSKNESPDGSPSQSVKRSYSSLLKYAPSLPQGNGLPRRIVTGNHGQSANGSLGDSDDEIVPTSQPPSQFDPLSLGIFQPYMADNIVSTGNDSDTLKNASNDSHSNSTNEQSIISDPTVMGSRTTDENDASIAFSKMFSRKRANTGGSMSSLTSLNAGLQQPQQMVQNPSHPQLPHSQSYSNLGNAVMPGNQRNLSFSSISSYGNKFSPVRTASPARPRSARSSLGLRISRDTNSFHDLPESSTSGVVAQEVFLDSQSTGKGKPMTAASARYKRKQDSLSDIHRIYTPSAVTSNASATPSSSLVTPPAFPAGYTAASSASSTPNALELSQLNNSASNSTFNNTNSGTNLESYGSHNASSVFYKDNSTELLLEDSDMPTPVENFPALKGIPRTTLEEKEEEEDNALKNTNRITTNHDRMHVPSNNETMDYVQLAQGGSTSSSQVDSLMTNSLSATTTSSVLGNHTFQDHANPILNTKDLKIDNHGKLMGKSPTNLGAIPQGKADLPNRNAKGNNNNVVTGPLSKLNMEFDFENSNSFFRDLQPQLQTQYKSNQASNNAYGNAQSNDFNSEPTDKQFQKNHSSTVNTKFKFPPESLANFSVEDMETSVGIPQDFFDRPSENGASKKPSNFPYYGTELGDFSYL